MVSSGDMPAGYTATSSSFSDAKSSILLWSYEFIKSGLRWTVCLYHFLNFMDLLLGQRWNSHNFPQLGFWLTPNTVAKVFSDSLDLHLFILLAPEYYIRDKLIASAVIWGSTVMVISYRSRFMKLAHLTCHLILLGLMLIVIKTLDIVAWEIVIQ